MRPIVFFSLAIISANITFGQDDNSIEYRVVSDEPERIPDNFLFLYYFDYQGGLLNNPDERHNAVGSLGSSVDVWQHVGPIVISGTFKLGYAGDASEAKKIHFKTDVGVSLPIGSRTKKKTAKVNVSLFTKIVSVEDEDGNFLGVAEVVGVNQILVPATYKYSRYARAGIDFQNGTYDRNLASIGTYNSLGIYAGFVRESRVNVVTQLLNREALSSQYIRMYVDGFFYPLLSTDVDPVGKKLPFGIRAGMQGSLPGMKNFINWMVPKVEIGFHGFHGTYFMVGFGVNLYDL